MKKNSKKEENDKFKNLNIEMLKKQNLCLFNEV